MEDIIINSMKDILIKYLLVDSSEWKLLELKPEDYFDLNEQSESYSVFDSIEKHFLDPRNYLKEDLDKILILNITISDSLGNKSESKFTYWDEGRSQIKETLEYKLGILSYRTIILSVNIDSENQKSLILRVEDIEGNLIPITQAMNDISNFYGYDLSIFDSLRS